MPTPATLAQIDRQIDAIQRKLRRIERISPWDAMSWQRAWDRHPDMEAQTQALLRQRDAIRFPGAQVTA